MKRLKAKYRLVGSRRRERPVHLAEGSEAPQAFGHRAADRVLVIRFPDDWGKLEGWEA